MHLGQYYQSFNYPETIHEDLMERVKKAKGIRAKLAEFSFYRKLHEIKNRLIYKRARNE